MRRRVNERRGAGWGKVQDEVEAAALLDVLHRDHVVPLVEDLARGEAAELDVEARHLVVSARAVLVPHLELERCRARVRDGEVELLVPARVQRVLDNARARAVARGAHAEDDVRVGRADVHLGDVARLDNPDVQLQGLGLHCLK